MADIQKLKKRAADFEAKRQMDKALAVYREMIEVYERGEDDPIDIPLYNRVGDLLHKSGNLPEAVSLWERAVDHYAEGGFYNPAIALCNKILRQSPGRAVVYYKLGKISAEKGFKAEARQNFLEYAERMQRGGNLNEAFRALKEFADLVPDQEDVRLMLAEHLQKANRKDEAVEQLQVVYAQMVLSERDAEAQSVVEKMKAIDPDVEPREPQGRASTKGGGLVFLDLDSPGGRRSSKSLRTPIAEVKRVTKAVEGLEILDMGIDSLTEEAVGGSAAGRSAVGGPAAGGGVDARPAPGSDGLVIEPTTLEILPDAVPTPAIDDLMLEPTQLGGGSATPPSGDMVGLEPTALGGDDELRDGIADVVAAEYGASVADVPVVEEPVVEEVAAEEPAVEEPVPEVIAAEEPVVEEVAAEELVVEVAASEEPVVEEPVVEEFAAEEPVVEEPVAEVVVVEEPVVEEPVAEVVVVEEPVVEEPVAEVIVVEEPVDPLAADSPTADSNRDDLPLLDSESVPTPTAGLPLIKDTPAVPQASTPQDESVAADLPDDAAADQDDDALDGSHAGPPRETMFVDMQVSDFGAFGEVEPFSVDDPATADSVLHAATMSGDALVPFGSTIDEEPITEFASIDDSTFIAPVEPTDIAGGLRESSQSLADSVGMLRERVAVMPDDPGLRRQLAEALIDDGQKDEGVTELEISLAGYEQAGDLDTAASIAEEMVHLAPTVIRHHQKRVEFAFRANDRRRLAEAYVDLGNALVRDGQMAKAKVVYQRVLDIEPDDLRAQAALETIGDVPAVEPTPLPRRSQPTVSPRESKPTPRPRRAAESEYVSLGDWLREDEQPKSTRMVVEEKEPTGDEAADFADMLRKFKQGIADNVDEGDHAAHYDLGVAYKEMGLLDEAISEFQKALRGTAERARTFEALGHCFVEKGQLPVAATILQRALNEPGIGDESLIGVLYLLGTISEELQVFADAKRYYQRVFAVDIQFRDVGERLNTVEQQLK